MVDALVSPAFVDAASRLLAEDPTVVEKALRGAIPALLSGIAGHADAKGSAGKVSRLIDSAEISATPLSALIAEPESAVEHMRTGSEMLQDIFGVRARRLVEAVAQHARTSDTAAASLLSLSAPLVVDMLRQLRERPDAPATLEWLGTRRTAISSMLPAEISTMTGLGGGLLSAGTARTAPPPIVNNPAPRFPVGGSRHRLIGVLVVALVLVLAAGAAYFARGRKHTAEPATVSLSLPNRTTVEVPASGFLYALSNFLAGKGDRVVPKTFACDPIDFYLDSSRLTPSASATVDSLAAILNAYPGVRFRLEGSASTQADADTNRRIAIDRTHAVGARLQADRVEANRMEWGVFTASAKSAPAESPLRIVITKLE